MGSGKAWGKSVFRDIKISRRGFLKASAALGAATALGGYAGSKNFNPTELFAPVEASPAKEVNTVKSICSFCAVGCGYIGVVEDGVFTKMEPWEDHPINQGGMCCKGASLVNVTNSPRRLRYPMEKSGGKWKRISWQEALDKVGGQLKKYMDNGEPDSVFMCGLVHGSNEESFMFRKFAMLYGTNNIDHQARICHSTTVAGLLNSFGHGAMTNSVEMLTQSKLFFFMGSNAAEAHPSLMQKVFEARDRGAKIIVADPRFTRTAAFADLFMQFRPGSDIALLMGIMNVLIENGWVDNDTIYNRAYGYSYLKEVVKDYPPEVVEDITWVPPEKIRECAAMMAQNFPGAVVWSMGATQHSVGTQIIRAFSILAVIMGWQGRPWGGGCVPIRGHDNVQGVTDMCVLSHFTPGYYTVKSAGSWAHWAKVFSETDSTSGKISEEELAARFITFTNVDGKEMNLQLTPGFTVSNWYKGVLMPPVEEIDQPTNIKMAIFWGEAISSITEMKDQKEALEKLEMLVVVDPFPTAAAALPERSDGIILLPAATRQEGSGSVTNTGRAWQWRYRVVPPLYDSKTDFEILQELANRVGFGDHFDYDSYEAATREINLGSRAIGNQGETPERMKRQIEYAHLFDPNTGRASGGPVDGEWWGLPWPCWTEDHPGTPVLYSDKLPVMEGGHDFRGNRVYPDDEPNAGQPLVRLSAPQFGTIHAQYAEDGVAYSKDLTGTIVKHALADGNPPTGRGQARIRVSTLADQIPVHREPIESPRPDLVEKYPTYPDQAHLYRICDCEFATEQQRSIAEKRHEKFPIVLTTGRQVEHHGGGAQTRSSDYLAEIMPEVYVEISPGLATSRGIRDGDMVWVESARGKIKVKAKVTDRVNDKTAFVPFHWNGIFEGEDYSDRWPEGTMELVRGDSVNIITSGGVDQVTQMQETKVALANIYKA
jgi:formate dehydrogenase major subunit